jgi:hypothetical protein
MRTDTCDRCGREIPAGMNGTVTISSDRQGGPAGGTWDACPPCRVELAGQFKTKPKPEVDLEALRYRCQLGDKEAIALWNDLSNIPWGGEDDSRRTPFGKPDAEDEG